MRHFDAEVSSFVANRTFCHLDAPPCIVCSEADKNLIASQRIYNSRLGL